MRVDVLTRVWMFRTQPQLRQGIAACNTIPWPDSHSIDLHIVRYWWPHCLTLLYSTWLLVTRWSNQNQYWNELCSSTYCTYAHPYVLYNRNQRDEEIYALSLSGYWYLAYTDVIHSTALCATCPHSVLSMASHPHIVQIEIAVQCSAVQCSAEQDTYYILLRSVPSIFLQDQSTGTTKKRKGRQEQKLHWGFLTDLPKSWLSHLEWYHTGEEYFRWQVRQWIRTEQSRTEELRTICHYPMPCDHFIGLVCLPPHNSWVSVVERVWN